MLGKAIPFIADCDAQFRTSEDGVQCQARHPQWWAGGRANYGVEIGGKYYYEATMMDDGLVRLGWSSIEASRELGTDRMVVWLCSCA